MGRAFLSRILEREPASGARFGKINFQKALVTLPLTVLQGTSAAALGCISVAEKKEHGSVELKKGRPETAGGILSTRIDTLAGGWRGRVAGALCQTLGGVSCSPSR